MDFESVTDVVRQLTLYPLDLIRKGGTDFIHPSTYRQYRPASLQIAIDICHLQEDLGPQDRVVQPRDFQSSAHALISTARSAVSFVDILSFVQSLCLLQIMALFSPTSTKEEREGGFRRQQLLADWTTKLWASAPTSLPSTLSTHEAYVLAEAVRRTIIVAHKIEGATRVLRTGFFKLTLFVESLPFGGNMDLWDSELRDDEIDVKDAGLLSYREYCDLWDAGLIHSATPFERLLLVACKGKAAVDERLGPQMKVGRQ
ncbi:uncharacterized protein Z518_08293 [Rhinocladiella mackenziei CBS 650.93]|uniref:Uncharacterized protein n=1 Tax=Rhinocladiella mackenziei CBS 650.93 TaxID=1442369 RepID=A0A0D2FK49_9EURO|nr:uncharacterized protein Z518_08293 [Rhinocladiella mackenziei CBS 650.93]KIX02352.1 hypothetical protein Z518_08293 [Rhinocladiella mackenziei CBS 650.93]